MFTNTGSAISVGEILVTVYKMYLCVGQLNWENVRKVTPPPPPQLRNMEPEKNILHHYQSELFQSLWTQGSRNKIKNKMPCFCLVYYGSHFLWILAKALSPTLISPTLLSPTLLSPTFFSTGLIFSDTLFTRTPVLRHVFHMTLLSPGLLSPTHLSETLLLPTLLFSDTPFTTTPFHQLYFHRHSFSPTLLPPTVLSLTLLSPTLLSPTPITVLKTLVGRW